MASAAATGRPKKFFSRAAGRPALGRIQFQSKIEFPRMRPSTGPQARVHARRRARAGVFNFRAKLNTPLGQHSISEQN